MCARRVHSDGQLGNLSGKIVFAEDGAVLHLACREMKRYILPLLQAVITVALLVWIIGDPKVRQDAGELLKVADLRWAALGLLAGGVNELAGALRWWCCMQMAGVPVGLRRATALHFMGLFATLFLPGSAGGDAVKIAWVAAEFPGRRIGGVLAALMDRLTGLVAITLVATLVAVTRHEWFASTPTTGTLFRAVMIFFALAAAALTFWGITSRPRFIQHHPQWLPMRAQIIEIASIFDLFFADKRRGATALGLSFVAFGAFFLIYYCAARALRVDVSLVDMMSIMPVVDVVTMLPVTLSGIGLREKVFETLLGALCGVPAAAAVLVSLGGFGLYACWSLLGAPVFLLYRTRRAKNSHDV